MSRSASRRMSACFLRNARASSAWTTALRFFPRSSLTGSCWLPPAVVRAASSSSSLAHPLNRVAWTASYALAKATDRVAGVDIPRTLDQRQTVTFDLTWRPSPAWRLSTALAVPHRWPTTSFTFQVDTLSSGEILVNRVYGPRNQERLLPYHRLDFRASRDWNVHGTRLSAFVDLFNAYDRRNERGYDALVTMNNGRIIYRRANRRAPPAAAELRNELAILNGLLSVAKLFYRDPWPASSSFSFSLLSPLDCGWSPSG